MKINQLTGEITLTQVEYFELMVRKTLLMRGRRKEEAAGNYAREQLANPDYPTYNDEYELMCAFEAGAKWQKEQIINKTLEWLMTEYEDIGIRWLRGHDAKNIVEDFKKYVEE